MKLRIFAIGLCILLAGIFLQAQQAKKQAQPKKQNTKKVQNYEQAWKQVDSLEKLDRPKTIFPILEGIYAKAKAENNTSEQVKSLIYILKYRNVLEEDADEKNVRWLKSEIAQSRQPAKALMQSILAQNLQNYYNANSWEILQQTNLEQPTPDSLSHWNATDFEREIKNWYLLSISEKNLLQKEPVRKFESILQKQTGSEILRPTLYDLLAHRAINYFTTNNTNRTQAAEAENITNTQLFANAKVFSTLDIYGLLPQLDKDDNRITALKVYQDLITFHLADENPNALTDVDLARLKYVHDILTTESKNDEYYNALLNIEEQYKEHEASAEAGFQRAQFIVNGYRPNGLDTTISLPKTALQICEKYIAKFRKSFGGRNCAYLKSTILAKDFQLQTEQTYLPQTAVKARLEYKNVSTVFYCVVSLPLDMFKESYSLDSATHARLKALKPVHQAQLNLPGTDDLLQHSTEFMINGLELGLYAVVVSANKDFSWENNQVLWSKFAVTNLSAVTETRPADKKTLLYIREAKNGSPVDGAEVKMFTANYNSSQRKWEKILSDTKTTGKDGKIELTADKNHRSYSFEIRKNKDLLPVNEGVSVNDYYPAQTQQTRTFFFTDRSIYRPGQTVYFKGIRLENNGSGTAPKLITNHLATVQFKDANGELINQKDFTTNEFGSYHGMFIIPNNLLSGTFQIQDDAGAVSVQVEEYKRPNFEVVLDTLKSTYRLNEKITQTGKAETYSGAALNNAKVKYRVVRQVNFPIWMYWKSFPFSAPTEIANGTVQTDAEGKFNIDFTALPDPKINKKDKPEFTYTITADVTSQSGETQSTETYMTIGYTALRAEIQMPEWLDNTLTQQVKVEATNFSGQKINIAGTLKIEKLAEPEKPLRKRLWQSPDKHILSREEYTKHFPHDAYMDEDQVYNYPVENTLTNREMNTSSSLTFEERTVKKWPAGNYKVTFTAKDAFGETVEAIKYIKVYSPKDKKPAFTEFFYAIPQKIQNVQPGEKAVWLIGSAANTNAHIVAERDGKVYFDEWIKLENEQQRVEIPVKAEHIGGLFVTITAIAENRHYHKTEKIDVPWPKRNLEITTTTWRNKTKPGAQEKWTFSIKGPDAQKAAAEMLAGMYDASLDAFLPHNWYFDISPEIYAQTYTEALAFGGSSQGIGHQSGWNDYNSPIQRNYDDLLHMYAYGYYGSRGKALITLESRNLNDDVTVSNGAVDADKSMKFTPPAIEEQQSAQQKSPTQIRKNKNETAFFYPQLRTNENGEVSFEFTLPDALTLWKFMAFAHTQDVKYGSYQKTIITQKELMIQPNLPRFLRAGDEIEFSANLTNLSGENIKSEVRIKLFDAYTMKYLGDEILENKASANQFISLQNGETKNIRWKIKTPQNTDGILYQLIATGGKFSDGEEGLIPVLPNRMLVTETMPMYVRGNSTKNYIFDALTNTSKTASPYKLTLEITSNPSWFAVQALPYLMENQYENAEQVFNRFYANALSQHIVKSNPQIKQVFESWKTGTALQSNLEKNQELKNLLLQETPWLAEGRNETERKQRIALLFDENNMAQSMESAISKLEQMQRPDGGWPWFEGMPTDRFITQYIVTGLGRMEKMNLQTGHLERLRSMMIKAVLYMDEQMLAEHENIKKHHAKTLNDNHLSAGIVQYFYARSYFKYVPMQKPYQFAYVYWQQQVAKHWVTLSLHQKAMLAIAMRQIDNDKQAHKILDAIDEYALHSEEMGMYWKEAQTRGYFWHQQPTETQAVLIEAYDLIERNTEAVEEMKLWLLKQKQTQNWGSSKATADAVYAIIMTGKNQLSSQKQVKVFLDNSLYDPAKADIKPEQGTGYYKTSWSGTEIKPALGNIKLQKEDDGSAWGAAYYQYYEDINAVKGNTGSLSISKSLFVKENTAKGQQLKPITANTPLKTGDLLTVKVRIKTDRNMEYIHVKDMRAAALEPTETLSGYQWKGGLGYYQAIKDASMNFFISYLPKGEYTFEYTLRVSQSGTFSNGISQIQCFYAPEFSGQTGSVKLSIEK